MKIIVKKTTFLLFFTGFYVCSQSVYANKYHANVTHADISLQNRDYLLSADIDYQLSPQANEALENGVPLFWCIKVKVQKPQSFWFDKTLQQYTLHYRLQYHALLNMYRVKNENTGSVNNFSTLSAALNSMAMVRDLPLIASQKLLPQISYSVAVKVIFEDEKLPLPLQTQVIANSQWQLSSDWTRWEIPK